MAAFNASSWWQEVDALGQERSWAAERAALGTPSPSWAAEPGTDTAWLELDLGTRRNVTGQHVSAGGWGWWLSPRHPGHCPGGTPTLPIEATAPPPRAQPVTPRRV